MLIARFIPACAGNAAADCPHGVALDRFIPACAGNATHAGAAMRPTTAVHPRVCGERMRRPGIARSISGSSPRVRGTPSRFRRDSG